MTIQATAIKAQIENLRREANTVVAECKAGAGFNHADRIAKICDEVLRIQKGLKNELHAMSYRGGFIAAQARPEHRFSANQSTQAKKQNISKLEKEMEGLASLANAFKDLIKILQNRDQFKSELELSHDKVSELDAFWTRLQTIKQQILKATFDQDMNGQAKAEYALIKQDLTKHSLAQNNQTAMIGHSSSILVALLYLICIYCFGSAKK